MKRQIKFIAEVCKWFDKIGGNTYHSVKITDLQGNIITSDKMVYGYGSQYEVTTMELLLDNKWIPDTGDIFSYCRNNGYPVKYIVKQGLKREMYNNVEV